MALNRYTNSVDGTIPVPALLYDDEELLASQDSVGIYDGPQKSTNHQVGSIHTTTHRLFYIDTAHPFKHSFVLNLEHVSQTEYYAGLFKSSAKVTLHLFGDAHTVGAGSASVPSVDRGGSRGENVFESWICEVCGNRNPSGLSPAVARICALCGVPRSSVPQPVKKPILLPSHDQHLSSSLPSSSLSSSVNLTLPLTPPPHDTIACPACTFFNHASLSACEICGTPLPRPRPQSNVKSAPSSRPVSPDSTSGDAVLHVIKLSFRKGGDRPFYAVLKRSLKGKAWEAKGIGKRNPTKGSTPTSGEQTAGINGILRTVESSAQSTETDMKDALQDLEALMVKAKDMVRLAAELNNKLTASSSTTATSSSNASPTLVPSTEPEEATFIRSSLSQLGLQMPNAPVTLDMIRDERRWIEELARELARVLQGDGGSGKETGLMRDRGIVALDEIWGGWNRARGVALIPPSTFLLVLPHLPTHTAPPVRVRTFASGLTVLHTPPYTHLAFATRLNALLASAGPRTTLEVAGAEGIPLALAGEMVGAVEAEGGVCRDEARSAIRGGGGGAEDVRWWVDVFEGYLWDGQV